MDERELEVLARYREATAAVAPPAGLTDDLVAFATQGEAEGGWWSDAARIGPRAVLVGAVAAALAAGLLVFRTWQLLERLYLLHVGGIS